MKTLPASPVVTGEYRALTLYEAAPWDCGTSLVEDDRFAPHLRAGEMAIVDPDDNDVVAGEPRGDGLNRFNLPHDG